MHNVAAAIFFQSTWLVAIVCEFNMHEGIWLKLNRVNILSYTLAACVIKSATSVESVVYMHSSGLHTELMVSVAGV